MIPDLALARDLALKMRKHTLLPTVLLAASSIFVLTSFLLVEVTFEPDANGNDMFLPTNMARHMAENRTEKSIAIDDHDWKHPFVHIVNTRFMQTQGTLVALARARLLLFETFCLGSILGQTLLKQPYKDPPFLWIIKSDPNLDKSILKDFVALVEPYPFIYFVASNVNYGIGIHKGGWRGGEAGLDVLQSQVYTGDMHLFRRAHAAREDRAILETRLDADDGLRANYLETIQNDARRKLLWEKDDHLIGSKQNWTYYCAANHLDWTPTQASSLDSATDYGLFNAYRSGENCITAGLTLGVSIGQEEASIPRYVHTALYKTFLGGAKDSQTPPDCGGNSTVEKCLHLVETPIPVVLRSRTTTSAGMLGVVTDEKEYAEQQKKAIPTNHSVFRGVLSAFHSELSKVYKTNLFLRDNFEKVVADNLRGQCTTGHSCKNKTKEILETMLRNTPIRGANVTVLR